LGTVRILILHSECFSGTIYITIRECGEIGRHDGLKIRCCKRREGSSPSVPIIWILKNYF
jgi:hypothetical protein